MKMLFKEKEDSKLLINLYCVKETQGGHSVVNNGIYSGHIRPPGGGRINKGSSMLGKN